MQQMVLVHLLQPEIQVLMEVLEVILEEAQVAAVVRQAAANLRRRVSAGEAGTWVQDETGWWFKKLNGSYPVSTWLMTGNEWYRFDDKGYMMTGWYTDENGKKYYLKSCFRRKPWSHEDGMADHRRKMVLFQHCIGWV